MDLKGYFGITDSKGERSWFTVDNQGNITIGNNLYILGNVGIGTIAPSEIVHAVGRGLFTEGVRVRSDVGDYGGGFATYTPPTGYSGLIITAADTNATTPGQRIYAYVNGAWHYVDLT